MKTLFTLTLLALAGSAFSQEKEKSDTTTFISIKENSFHTANLNAPLYILDNKEIEYADLNKIDTEKIQSITVLKDAASTAKYGARGVNGVIIIESKDAKKLLHKKRPTIE
jgi:TonB-dependent SusC/RagA subfamily outer membrane receptor